jgi:hypothetical protein
MKNYITLLLVLFTTTALAKAPKSSDNDLATIKISSDGSLKTDSM